MGSFRSASVLITGTDYEPPRHEYLERIWEEIVEEADTISDVYLKAFTVFLKMAKA